MQTNNRRDICRLDIADIQKCLSNHSLVDLQRLFIHYSAFPIDSSNFEVFTQHIAILGSLFGQNINDINILVMAADVLSTILQQTHESQLTILLENDFIANIFTLFPQYHTSNIISVLFSIFSENHDAIIALLMYLQNHDVINRIIIFCTESQKSIDDIVLSLDMITIILHNTRDLSFIQQILPSLFRLFFEFNTSNEVFNSVLKLFIELASLSVESAELLMNDQRIFELFQAHPPEHAPLLIVLASKLLQYPQYSDNDVLRSTLYAGLASADEPSYTAAALSISHLPHIEYDESRVAGLFSILQQSPSFPVREATIALLANTVLFATTEQTISMMNNGLVQVIESVIEVTDRKMDIIDALNTIALVASETGHAEWFEQIFQSDSILSFLEEMASSTTFEDNPTLASFLAMDEAGIPLLELME